MTIRKRARGASVGLFTGVITLALIASACRSGDSAEHHHHPTPAAQVAVADVATGDHVDEALYGCPMHKEMVGSKGDRCPKCDYMEMVPVTWSLEGVETVRVTDLPDYNPPKSQ